jgi:general secretion pathway protein C
MSSKGNRSNRPPLEKWYAYILLGFIGFAIADLVILNLRDKMLPNQAPPPRPKSQMVEAIPARSVYNTIIARNIFSSDGTIPDPITPKGQDPSKPQQEEPPVLSSLPLTLIGTLVHSNPERSIATLEIKGKNKILSFIAGREIEGFATLVKVERHKIIIRNTNNNRLEFIEMKDVGKLAFGLATPAANKGEGKGDVMQTGDNQFALKRSDLLKYTSDLSSILQQARAIPNRDPNTGEINGYRVLDIQPGSVYEQLGIQRMDVIKGVNGEKVDNPAKAMELYNQLKNSNAIKITVERNGKTEELSYTISQ